ncbi:MAG: hypothetical protein O0Y03_08690, partial [Methanocorpusculum sp.]|nr:hypothetical protein [Methanocorpusculum sp.]
VFPVSATHKGKRNRHLFFMTGDPITTAELSRRKLSAANSSPEKKYSGSHANSDAHAQPSKQQCGITPSETPSSPFPNRPGKTPALTHILFLGETAGRNGKRRKLPQIRTSEPYESQAAHLTLPTHNATGPGQILMYHPRHTE